LFQDTRTGISVAFWRRFSRLFYPLAGGFAKPTTGTATITAKLIAYFVGIHARRVQPVRRFCFTVSNTSPHRTARAIDPATNHATSLRSGAALLIFQDNRLTNFELCNSKAVNHTAYMEFTIPKDAETPLSEFVALNSDDFSRLVSAILSAKPALRIESFAVEVAEVSKLDLPKVRSIVGLFAGMYLARADTSVPLETFVNDLLKALADNPQLYKPVDSEALSKALIDILSAEESLGVSAKSFDLFIDQEKNLHSTRIITDVRYVFAADAAAQPKAAVVLHNLKIAYHRDDGIAEFYVALDNTDLKQLMSVVERAIVKGDTLKKMLQAGEINCLEN
jgi:hypothetical protein